MLGGEENREYSDRNAIVDAQSHTCDRYESWWCCDCVDISNASVSVDRC